ncbi:MAG: hypothetical protein KGL39_24720 [Patescibacteria group bacterium]|nr:hypothetical protein [Patescibacteria group bacterium]
MKQGSEPVNHSIWEGRIARLVAFLKGKPRTASELIKDLNTKKKWPSYFSTNVIAASDMAGAIKYRLSDRKWYV